MQVPFANITSSPTTSSPLMLEVVVEDPEQRIFSGPPGSEVPSCECSTLQALGFSENARSLPRAPIILELPVLI